MEGRASKLWILTFVRMTGWFSLLTEAWRFCAADRFAGCR